MKTKMLGLVLVLRFALLAGCGIEEPAAPDATAAAALAEAPALDKADDGTAGADSADHACQVVLRRAAREPAADWSDYETDCGTGECLYVWRGQVDVAEGVDPAASVAVLYHLTSDSEWWETAVEPLPVSTPGYRSYSFAISEHLFGPGADGAIELVAFARGTDGGRLFDHNARPGDFDNAVLNGESYWSTGDKGVCQPVVGDIYFGADWFVTDHGARRQGGYLRVTYDLARLPDCRNTHNGYPCWDTVAHARFLPGGQEVSASVRRNLTVNGTPTAEFEAVPFVTLIPEDAEAVELWFENSSGCGSSCRTWDSNFGDNFRYDVWPAADDPRCLEVEHGDGSHYEDYRMAWNVPVCLAYDIAEQFDAGYCEFHLDGIGLGYVGHYGIPFHWLLAYLRVGAQDGEVQNVGLFTRYHDAAGKSGIRFALGVEEQPGLWRAGFAYQVTGFQGVVGRDLTIDEYAFFLDVQRPSGEVVRLWQSRGGQNYRPDDAFSLPTTTEYIPYGNIAWSDQASAVFDTKRACAQ